jgi:hypothetical protein
MLRDRRIERTVGENTKVMAGSPSTITWRSRPTERDQRVRAEVKCWAVAANLFCNEMPLLAATIVSVAGEVVVFL